MCYHLMHKKNNLLVLKSKSKNNEKNVFSIRKSLRNKCQELTRLKILEKLFFVESMFFSYKFDKYTLHKLI